MLKRTASRLACTRSIVNRNVSSGRLVELQTHEGSATVSNVNRAAVFRDLAELQRLGFPVTFGNGYPAQQELFRRRRRQEMSQVLADLVEQQLEVVRRKLPADEAEQLVNEAIRYLPMEAAEAVTRALAKAARR